MQGIDLKRTSQRRRWTAYTLLAVAQGAAPIFVSQALAQSTPMPDDVTQHPLYTGSGLARLPAGVERPPAMRPGWTFDIKGASDFTYTDNVYLTSTNRQADFLISPKAIFQATDFGSHAAVSARTEFDYDFYTKATDLDGFRPKAVILGKADVVEDELTMDARLATNLQQVSSQDRTPATERTIDTNQIQVLNVGARPTWTEYFQNGIRSEVFYDVAAVGFLGRGSVIAGDTFRHLGHVGLSNGSAFDRFGWSVSGEYEHSTYLERGNIEALGQYRVSNTFALTGHAGNDWYPSGVVTPGGPFALAGFSWNPAQLISVRAEAGYRYKDFNANAQVSVTLARAFNISASYVSDIENTQLALINALADLARDPFGNLLLTPGTGMPYVMSGQFDANGVPLPDPNKSPFTFTNTLFKRDQGQVGVWGSIGRNSYSVTATYEKRKSELGKANSWGGGASLSRRLSPHLSVTVEANYERVKGTEEVFSLAALDAKTVSGKAQANYRLGPTVTASLRYVYLQRQTIRADYRENVGVLGLVKTF